MKTHNQKSILDPSIKNLSDEDAELKYYEVENSIIVDAPEYKLRFILGSDKATLEYPNPEGFTVNAAGSNMYDVAELSPDWITPCARYAYFGKIPAAPKADIRRLGESLAPFVTEKYTLGTDEETIKRLMQTRGIFGIFEGGNLAGFIGRHPEGSMGLLEIFEPYRRKGYGEALETFLIRYVMAEGKIPYCDVIDGNEPSRALQEKLGLEKINDVVWFGKAEK